MLKAFLKAFNIEEAHVSWKQMEDQGPKRPRHHQLMEGQKVNATLVDGKEWQEVTMFNRRSSKQKNTRPSDKITSAKC